MSTPSGMRLRSIRSEMQRAKADIARRVSGPEMGARLDDHRLGMHARPYNHRHHCWACLAWCRRDEKRRELA